MARKVRDKGMDTREARGKLKPRGKPYYREIERGLHLGYRRLRGRAGTWWARHYIGNQAYKIVSIGAADDLSDADGVAILDYWQAQIKAREMMVKRAHQAAGKTGPLNVADAMRGYLDYLDTNKKSGADARYRYEALIKPVLGDIEVNNLTADMISDWHVALAKQPARVRTGKDKRQQHRELGKDTEAVRRRRATANRTLTILRAALNRAWRMRRKLVPSDAEWRAVKPFENANAARFQHLSVDEAKRLINACEPNFRKLVQAALQTGCRYGELCRLTVADLNPNAGTLAVMVSKTGKPRQVVLTEEGVAFFRDLCTGRTGDEFMLTRKGLPWGKSHQAPPIAAACKIANIRPAITFHALRHTYASLAVENGMPLLVLAGNLGHADTKMVETHYGHMTETHITKAIRASAPRFGFKPDLKVRQLRVSS
jgi:integrase